ncbi:MAG: VOC family protein [Chloroflexota bacterium]|nr:VOC family protein [Chloroflexota bacterium]
MELGNFSVSLPVKDIEKSMVFYKALGFSVIDGGHQNKQYPDTEDAKWRILESKSVVIGLFQGQFDERILTFNPPNVRAIQRRLDEAGIELIDRAEGEGDAPAYITLRDPDGNLIMFDQF